MKLFESAFCVDGLVNIEVTVFIKIVESFKSEVYVCFRIRLSIDIEDLPSFEKRLGESPDDSLAELSIASYQD